MQLGAGRFARARAVRCQMIRRMVAGCRAVVMVVVATWCLATVRSRMSHPPQRSSHMHGMRGLVRLCGIRRLCDESRQLRASSRRLASAGYALANTAGTGWRILSSMGVCATVMMMRLVASVGCAPCVARSIARGTALTWYARRAPGCARARATYAGRCAPRARAVLVRARARVRSSGYGQFR